MNDERCESVQLCPLFVFNRSDSARCHCAEGKKDFVDCREKTTTAIVSEIFFETLLVTEYKHEGQETISLSDILFFNDNSLHFRMFAKFFFDA